MSYLVLARKWRPQTFAEVVGQEHVTRTLANAIRAGRVAHAFLFCGMRGVGKTTAARLLAKALNCEAGPTPEPCNRCSNCREITAGSAVDVMEIDGASNRGINEVRQIIENARYRPAKSRYKIYIIDEVHQVTHDAFNALLKTLEEPPPHVKFIFATTEAHRVPHTIVSRCQRYDFKRLSPRQIAQRLAEICREEGIQVSDAALYAIAREADGSLRDAQSLLDQLIAFAGKAIADGDLKTALGIADREVLYAVGRALVERQPLQAVEQLGALHLFGYDLRRFTRDLLEHFRNLAVAKLGGGKALLGELPEEERQEVSRQAASMRAEDIDRAFRVLLGAEEEIGRSPCPKLVLEMALIKVATMPPVVPVEEVLERLDASLKARGESSGQPAGFAEERVSDSAAGGTGWVADPGPQGPAGEQSGAANWQEFLAFVERERPLLAAHLRQCRALAMDGGTLEVEVPAGFHRDYLAREEQMSLVGNLASRFYGSPVRLSLREAAPAETSRAKKQATREPKPREMLRERAVQAVIDILGGEVQEVKSRGGTGP